MRPDAPPSDFAVKVHVARRSVVGFQPAPPKGAHSIRDLRALDSFLTLRRKLTKAIRIISEPHYDFFFDFLLFTCGGGLLNFLKGRPEASAPSFPAAP